MLSAAVVLVKPDTGQAALETGGASPVPAATSRLAAPPAPPRAYRLPQNAIWVSNSTQLRLALSRYVSRDIVLRNGVYDNSTPFSNPGGDRLYAQTLGQAVLTAGISMGGNWGPGGGLVQGISFDIADPSKALQGSIIHIWGTGTFTHILDVTLEGHSVVNAGILAREVDGLVVRRVVARHFRNWGVSIDENDPDAQVANPPVITDIDAAYVSWPTPRSSNGTAEACVWIGNTAIVRRVRAHDCAWEGLWAGTAANHALFTDIRVWNIDIGVYVEHFVRSSTFTRLQIGPTVKVGLLCEWADPAWGSQPACVGNSIQQSTFDTSVVGVYLDQGTTDTTVRESTFVNQCWAAISSYKGVDNLYDTGGNDYRSLQVQAIPISTKHFSAAPCPQ